MRSLGKKLTGMALLFALLMGMVFTPGTKSLAASEGMQGAKVNWNLKLNKTYKYKIMYAGGVKGKITSKISNYKITNASKEGYKKLTFDYTIKHPYKVTQKQLNKILDSKLRRQHNEIGCYWWYAIVDYSSGIDLEYSNDYDVTVKVLKSKVLKNHKYKRKNGDWIKLVDFKKTVSVVYPEDYTDLCLSMGALSSRASDTIREENFWDGENYFKNTCFYSKKDRKNCNWLKVTQ